MKVTQSAQEELKKALDSFNQTGVGIRIFSTSGCCGTSIQMEIVKQVNKGETVVTQEGIDFFVVNDLLTTLEKVIIDFGANGFRLDGLKKSGSCCG